MEPFIPPDVDLIRKGRWSFSGSLLLADISGFTGLTGRLALHGKRGTEELSEILNRFFSTMYDTVRSHGGCVLSSAGDSMLVRFPEEADPSVCAGRMMERMDGFKSLGTIAGEFGLDIRIVIGRGKWGEFILGDGKGAQVLVAGDLVSRMAVAEESTRSGEIVSVCSQVEPGLEYTAPEGITDSSFTVPGTKGLPGEHRSISALFVNVTGYDPAHPPLAGISDLFGHVSEIAGRHGGVVQMLDSMLPGGCRMFLLFGAPVSYGNDTTGAVTAGMEVLHRTRSLESLQVSMGMDEGFAFAGVIGSHWRRHYTVIGEVVNAAAGIADAVGPGQFGVSERVTRMTRNEFLYSEMDRVSLRGRKGPVSLFKPESRRSTPVYSYAFVGRRRETRELMESVLSGGCLTILEGEAGIGKTRFLDRLSLLLRSRGVTVLAGTSSRRDQTNGIFSSLVGEMSGMTEGDSQSVRKSRLWHLIGELEETPGTLSRREAFLGRMLFSIDYPDSDYDRIPPRLRRENLIDGICELILSGPGGKCLILDDLQNCTDEDLQAVEYICRKVLDHPRGDVSVILSRRPDDRPLLESGEPGAERITLGSLDSSSMDELTLEILGGNPMEEDLEALMRKRTEGNPFYLMQFLMYLIEEDLIALERGIWSRTPRYSDEQLPGNVFSMIMARIDRLERQAKESLRIGSVVGLRFDEEIVRRVAGKDVHTSLSQCSEAGLTYRSELRALEFVFSHTLIKDVTYDSILRKRRKQIHGSIGEILKEIHSEDPQAVCQDLAYHFRIAEMWPKAVDYSIMAGERAWSEYRNQNAVQHYLDAVGILKDHPEDTTVRLSDCYRELGRINDRIGEYESALEYYHLALECSVEPAMIGDVSLLKADILYTMGRVEESLELLDEVEEMLSATGEDHPLLLVRIECFRAWAYCVTGRIEAAMEKADLAVRLSESVTGVPEKDRIHRIGYAYNTLATVHWGKGDYDRAREYYLKAFEIARSQDLKREMSVTCGNIGLVSQKMGRLDEAVESFRMQHSLSTEIGEKLIILSSNGSLSSVYGTLGRIEEARETAETYLRQARELPAMQDMLLAYNQLGILNLAGGRSGDARECAENILNMPGSESYEREKTSALLLLGMVEMEEGGTDAALQLYGKAREMARGLRSKSLLLGVLAALIHCRTVIGDPEDPEEMLEQAQGLVREMGTETWDGRIILLKARILNLRGKYEESVEETEKAMDIFRHRGLRPALAEALRWRLMLLDSRSHSDDVQSEYRVNLATQLDRLESEMEILAGGSSPVLLMM